MATQQSPQSTATLKQWYQQATCRVCQYLPRDYNFLWGFSFVASVAALIIVLIVLSQITAKGERWTKQDHDIYAFDVETQIQQLQAGRQADQLRIQRLEDQLANLSTTQ